MRVTVNVNAPDETSSCQAAILDDVFNQLGPNIQLGFNIYKKDFDFSFLFDFIKRYYMSKVIRIGLAQPIVDMQNTYLPIEQYRSVGKRITKLAESAFKRNIRVSFDCGFVPCMFFKEDLARLEAVSSDLRFVCSPIIDINPDLIAWHCFPLSEMHNVCRKGFSSLKALYDHFEHQFFPYTSVGIYNYCPSCDWFIQKKCTGGCIAHKILNQRLTPLQ